MTHLPVRHIRVVDHTIAWAGPQATQLLADMGAEVIKIEAINRIDVMRGGGRRAGKEEKFWERGGWYIQLNRNKLGITIDLSQKAGRELYFKLVAVSDVVIDNFTPRVMPNLGLDYEDLKKVKQDIIALRMPGYGTSGPYRDAPAFGDCINAFCGLDDITGYPDGGPQRPGIAWGDPTSGLAAAFAILAAVHHRSVTGQGQYVEISHLEAASNAMDGLIDYAMNKRVQKRMANRDPLMAPQGCYPCRGEDQWIVITIADNSDWSKFGAAVGNPQWSKDPRFDTVEGRREHHDELDAQIAASTRNYNRYDIMDLLQKAGIAAAPMLYPGELLKDSHFMQRGFFEDSDHPCEGKLFLPGMICKMSQTPCQVRSPAPLLGEHNQYVFETILGLSKDEVEKLAGDGIIGTEPVFDLG